MPDNRKPVEKHILKAVDREIARDKERKMATEITYDDYCEWHDSGTGDCENS